MRCFSCAAAERSSNLQCICPTHATIHTPPTNVQMEIAPEMSCDPPLKDLAEIRKYVPAQAAGECREARNVLAKWAVVAERRPRDARDTLAAMLTGRTVTLSCDSADRPRDPWARPFVYVCVHGTCPAEPLLSLGLVITDTHFPCDRLVDCLDTQQHAQQNGTRIWHPDNPPRPLPPSSLQLLSPVFFLPPYSLESPTRQSRYGDGAPTAYSLSPMPAP